MLARVQKKKSISITSIELYFSELIRYINFIKNLLIQTNIINALNKLIIKINCNYKKLKKDITIIRKIIIEFLFQFFFFFSIYSKNNLQS